MNIENRIWALVAKDLANEASKADLQEMDEMLKRYPDTDKMVKTIADWWRQDSQEEMERRGAALFERIKATIKAMEDEASNKSNFGQ